MYVGVEILSMFVKIASSDNSNNKAFSFLCWFMYSQRIYVFDFLQVEFDSDEEDPNVCLG